MRLNLGPYFLQIRMGFVGLLLLGHPQRETGLCRDVWVHCTVAHL